MLRLRGATRIHAVISASEALGRSTLDVVFTPKRFADGNPKVVGVFVAAMEEANASILSDPWAAAQPFIKVAGGKRTKDEVVANAASWQDLFVPQRYDKAGS